MTQGLGVLIVFGFVLLSIWSVMRPPWAFALINLMFLLKQVLQGYFPQLVLYGPHLSAAIAMIGGLSVLMKSTRKTLTISTFFNPVTWCTFGIYTMVSFGLLYTPAFDSGYKMFTEGLPYFVVLLLVYPFLLSSLEELRQGMFLTVMIGCVLTFAYLFNPSAAWTNGRFIVNLGQEFGVSDYTSNPLALADTGGFLMIAAALLNFKDKGKLGIVFTVAGLVMGLGLAIISGSRGQIIFAVVISIMLYPLARQVKDKKQFFLMAAGVGFMLAVIAITFSVFLEGEAARRWDVTLLKQGSTDRSTRFFDSLGFYAANPGNWIFGNGTNAFTFFVGSIRDYPHNISVEILLEYGVVGIVIFYTCVWFTFKYARNLLKMETEDPIARSTVAAWIGICLFAFLLSHKQGSLIGLPAPFYIWIVLAKIYFDEMRARQAHQYAPEPEESAWGSGDYEPVIEPDPSLGRA